jgi:ABC-type uncharacterized transport system YnjBCD ATPase subunit
VFSGALGVALIRMLLGSPSGLVILQCSQLDVAIVQITHDNVFSLSSKVAEPQAETESLYN